MVNEKPCFRCGQLISASATACPLCHADQTAPSMLFEGYRPEWTPVDTMRIGFGIWLNMFVLMVGTIIATVAMGIAMGSYDAEPVRAGASDLGALAGSADRLAAMSSLRGVFGLIVSAAVWAPFFAWSVGNSIKLVGDGLNRRKR